MRHSLCTLLQSADHAWLITSYLAMDDLMQCSSLSHSLHPLFDGEAVWHGRLRAVEATQHIPVELVPRVPESAILSPEALAALPPLPSLIEAATLCFTAFMNTRQQQQRTVWRRAGEVKSQPHVPGSPRITAVVHLPATLLYHARFSSTYPCSTVHELAWVEHAWVEFTLRRGDEQPWAVAKVGDYRSGKWALDVEDNIGDMEERAHADTVTAIPSTRPVSSKQRFVNLLRCSEHEYGQCNRLVQPTSPLAFIEKRNKRFLPTPPPVCPLPLCSSCRAAISPSIFRAAAYSATDVLQSVARINSSLYEVEIIQPPFSDSSPVRVMVVHKPRTTQQQEAAKQHVTGDSKRGYRTYEVVTNLTRPAPSSYVFRSDRCPCNQGRS